MLKGCTAITVQGLNAIEYYGLTLIPSSFDTLFVIDSDNLLHKCSSGCNFSLCVCCYIWRGYCWNMGKYVLLVSCKT